MLASDSAARFGRNVGGDFERPACSGTRRAVVEYSLEMERRPVDLGATPRGSLPYGRRSCSHKLNHGGIRWHMREQDSRRQPPALSHRAAANAFFPSPAEEASRRRCCRSMAVRSVAPQWLSTLSPYVLLSSGWREGRLVSPGHGRANYRFVADACTGRSRRLRRGRFSLHQRRAGKLGWFPPSMRR